MTASDKRTSFVDRSFFREIAGGFLFYLGISALTLYPLGFIALGVQP